MIDGEGTHKTSLNIRRDLLAVLDAEVERHGSNRAALIIRYLTEGLERDAQRDLVASGALPQPPISPAVQPAPVATAEPRQVQIHTEPLTPVPVRVQSPAERKLEPYPFPYRPRTSSWSDRLHPKQIAAGALAVMAVLWLLPGTSAPALFVARAVVGEPRNPVAAGILILKHGHADSDAYNRLAGMALVGDNERRIDACYSKANRRFAGTPNWRKLQSCTVYVPTSRRGRDAMLGVPDGE